MEKCTAYQEIPSTGEGMCIGVKEPTTTTCKGNKCACTEYIDIREKALRNQKRNTAQMWLEAQENPDKWFVANNMYYNQKYGFCNKKKEPWDNGSIETFVEIMSITEWVETDDPIPPIELTRKQLLTQYGIKVVD